MPVRLWLIWVILILGIFVGGVRLTPTLINNAINEFYSPTFTSKSIADARARGMFVAQPALENNVFQWLNKKYIIREVWIENIIRIKYDWIFFRRSIPIGYRLMLRIENPPDFLEQSIICNNSIQLNGWGGENVRFADISPPLPSSVRCTLTKFLPP